MILPPANSGMENLDRVSKWQCFHQTEGTAASHHAKPLEPAGYLNPK
jgi:hypothetical protein